MKAIHEIDNFGIHADKPWTNEQKSFAAQVTRIDSDVGELVDTLKELGVDKNTLVIFTGDNGSSFSPESDIGKLFDQHANGLRGFKRGLYEGALRQASIAWWPGTVPAGRVRDEPWAFCHRHRAEALDLACVDVNNTLLYKGWPRGAACL